MYVWIEGWIGPNVIIDNIYIQRYNRQTDRHMLAVLASIILGQILNFEPHYYDS